MFVCICLYSFLMMQILSPYTIYTYIKAIPMSILYKCSFKCVANEKKFFTTVCDFLYLFHTFCLLLLLSFNMHIYEFYISFFHAKLNVRLSIETICLFVADHMALVKFNSIFKFLFSAENH